MSFTQFSMVEELASLIKDNLPCKYLVLSVEEALVNFLLDDTRNIEFLEKEKKILFVHNLISSCCFDGKMELEPMNSYSRLLIHRLAHIFGFSHHSVGEGDDRHLVLERCPETSIPSILVSDLLWQYNDSVSPKILEVAKRKEDSPGSSAVNPKFDISLEEREAAYLAARERIFSVNESETGEPVKHRPQNNPVVARRMIAHALGHRIRPPSCQEVSQNSNTKIQEEEERASSTGTQTIRGGGNDMTMKYLNSSNKEKASMSSGNSSLHSQTKTSRENIDKTITHSVPSCKERGDKNVQKANFRQEHMGAAKRMFANAMGFQPRNANLPKSSQSK